MFVDFSNKSLCALLRSSRLMLMLTAEGAKKGYKRFIKKISDRIYRIDRINSTSEFCNRFSKSLTRDKLWSFDCPEYFWYYFCSGSGVESGTGVGLGSGIGSGGLGLGGGC